MEAKLIIKRLLEKGFTQSMISEGLNRSPSLVSKVISGKARSQLVEKAICHILGEPTSVVFPNHRCTPMKGSKERTDKVEALREIFGKDTV